MNKVYVVSRTHDYDYHDDSNHDYDNFLEGAFSSLESVTEFIKSEIQKDMDAGELDKRYFTLKPEEVTVKEELNKVQYFEFFNDGNLAVYFETILLEVK